MQLRSRRSAIPFALVVLLTGCSRGPTAEQAGKFVEAAEADLMRLANEAGQAQWVQSNFITGDTEAMAARANEKFIQAGVRYAKEAARFKGVAVSRSRP